MKPLYKKIFFLSVGLLAVLAVTFAGVRINSKKAAVKLKKAFDTVADITIDTAKLRLFTKAGKTVDFNAKSLSISGNLSIHDGSDSTVNLNNVPYRFIKEGNNFYYSMGLTEALNFDGYYIQADRGQKKMMISAEKAINPQAMFPEIDKLVEHLKDERYQIVETPVAEGFRKISMLNPKHISCKEYSITFNEATFKPTEVFIRLSNLDDPLNTKMDKTIHMRYTENKELQSNEALSISRFVKKTDNGFNAVGIYKDFEVININ